jgi:hypothetical protein
VTGFRFGAKRGGPGLLVARRAPPDPIERIGINVVRQSVPDPLSCNQ